MRVFSITTELDHLLPDIDFTSNPNEAELLILGTSRLSVDVFPKARGVFRTGVGTDNIDSAQLDDRKIALELPSTRTREIIYDETAAFSTHLILSALYRTSWDFATWQRESRTHVRERTVLLVGCGNIGSRVRRNLENAVQILISDPIVEGSVILEEAIEIADVISLHIPPIEENIDMVNKSFLTKMKDGASIVNTARGALVDEFALARELKTHRIFAYLDVFVDEPYSGPLTEFIGTNLFASPHIASTSASFFASMAEDFREFHTSFLQ